MAANVVRKIAGGTAPSTARAGACAALTRTFARTVQRMLGLSLVLGDSRLHELCASKLEETWKLPSMLTVLDGPDGAVGGMEISMDLVSALVEIQTVGRLSDTRVAPRFPTQVETALVAPVIDDVLAEFAKLPETQGRDSAAATPFRYGATLKDRLALSLALDAQKFEVFELTFSLQNLDRQGTITLALPCVDPPTTDEPDQVHSADLAQHVVQAHAEMSVVLTRFHMTVAQLQGLATGGMVDLLHANLPAAMLETSEGKQIAEISLGQINGQRAIRLAPLPLNTATDHDMAMNTRSGTEIAAIAPSDAGEKTPPAASAEGGDVAVDAKAGGQPLTVAPLSDVAPMDLLETVAPVVSGKLVTKA